MVQSFVRTARAWQKHVQAFLLASTIGAAVLAPCASLAQNLGTTPATGRAVQGQTASQPEGAFLNAVNWLCNVICPVGAGIAVVATILQWRSGRSWLPSAMTAGGLICVSGILRLIEYFIAQGQAVGYPQGSHVVRNVPYYALPRVLPSSRLSPVRVCRFMAYARVLRTHSREGDSPQEAVLGSDVRRMLAN
jgi:hypothetical protein